MKLCAALIPEIVITNDIPLAAEVIDQQTLALSPRGELFSKSNIGARLNMRDFLETMRGSGEHTEALHLSAMPTRSSSDQLDRLLASRTGQRLLSARLSGWTCDLRRFDIQRG